MNRSPAAAASVAAHDAISVHRGLERADRVDLADHDVGAHAVCPGRDAAADPAIAAHHDGLAGEEDVGCSQDAVDRRLAGPVAVVEQVLGQCLVDRDDRVAQDAVVCHRPQADDAGRRLLGAADDPVQEVGALRVQLVHEIGPVIHRDVGQVVERLADVGVVRVAVLALDGVGRDPVVGDERGGDVVLGRERVRGAQHRVGTPRGEGAHQVRRLGGDVQAGADPPTLQRPITLEALANAGKHRHLAVGPFDLQPPGVGQGEVGHVGRLHFDSRCHGIRIASRIGRISPQPP